MRIHVSHPSHPPCTGEPCRSLIRRFALLGSWLVALAGLAAPVAAADRYAATDGVFGNDCATPATACTIQDAITAAAAGDTVHVAPGTYSDAIVLNKAVHLAGSSAAGVKSNALRAGTMAGPVAPPVVIIDGGGTQAVGVTIASGVTNAAVSGIEVRNFTSDCVRAVGGNHGLLVEESHVHHCGRHGIYANASGAGGLASVTIRNNQLHDIYNRAIVVWNGFKQDITVSDNLITGPVGATAIAFEDGTATGIHVTGNQIDHSLGGDTGIAAMQLTSGSPSGRGNLIRGNFVFDPGRFGIALMIPNGSGAESGDGSIVVENNTVIGGTNQGAWLEDDRAGIQVIRAYYGGASQGQIDVTRGVVVRSNEVNDFTKQAGVPAGSEAYGIVVEGMGSSVYLNILTGNDVGLQIQQGNQPGSLPGNANPDIHSDWFDRGNTPLTCASVGEGVDANAIMGSTIADQRSVPADADMIGSRVLNQNNGTRYCTLNSAIAMANDGDVLVADPGVYAERLTIDKPVTLLGARHGIDARTRNSDNSDTGESVLVPPETQAGLSMASYFSSRLIGVGAAGVIIDGFVLDGDNPALASGVDLNGADIDYASGILAYGDSAGLQVRNNIIRNMQSGGLFGYAHVGDNIVEFNRFSNIPAPSEWGIAVLSTNHWYAQIRNNLFDTVRIGVQSNLLQLANPGTLEPIIVGNEFHAQYRGVFLNQNGGAVATSHRVEGNSFHAVAGTGLVEPWQAVWIQGLTGSREIQVIDNQIDGSGLSGRTRIGYYLNNITSTAVPTTRVISGGTVGNVDIGVLATDAGYFTGPVNDFVVRGVSFSGVGTALHVEDTTFTGNARLSVGAGNDFAGATWPVALSGPEATLGMADGVSGVDRILVKSAQISNVWNGPDSSNATHDVAAATINNGIAGASVGGVVQVEAGTFAQTVLVDKAVRLLGAQADVSAKGAVAERVGGETIIAPDAPVRVQIPAAGAGAEVNGFTVSGVSGSTNANSAAFNITGSGAIVRNNRVLGINGNGVYLSTSGVANVLVEQNHFGNLAGGSYNGVKTEGSINLSMIDNSFDNIAYQGVQLGGSNNGAQVRNNVIANTAQGGINIGGGTSIVIDRNTLNLADTSGTADRAAIRIYPGVGAAVSCNTIGADNNRGVYFHSAAGTHQARVFHNAILAGVSLVNGNANVVEVGSNWYDGATSAAGTAMAVADPLAADPVGNALCGDNTPSSIVAHGGTGVQSTPVDSAFNDLRVRVQDRFGGAAVGQTVSFSDPASSTAAGATLGAVSGITDYNGELVTTATANSFAGTYTVTASSGTLTPDAAFTLTNTQGTATVTVADATVAYSGASHSVAVTTAPAGLEGDVQIVYSQGATTVATCAATDAGCGPVNAGTYTATATVVGNPNYAGSGSGTLTITRAASTIAFDPLSFEYNGATHAVGAYLVDEPGTACPVTGTVGPDVSGSPYVVNATACTGTNFEAPAASASAEVTPQPITITLGHLAQAHDGSPKSVSVTTSPTAGVAVSVTYDGTSAPPSAIGSYAVAAVTNDPNYSGSATATLVIGKTVGTVSFDPPLSGTYGTTHAVSAGIVEESPSVCTYSGVPGPSDPVGSYLVTADCESSGYVASGSAMYEVTAGIDVSIEATMAAPVGVVTLVPQPDADAGKSYYDWRTNGSAGENVRAFFKVTSGNPAAAAGDLAVEYLDTSDSTWKSLPMTFAGGEWSGWFGPASGFPLVDGAVSSFRASFQRGGRYGTTASLVGMGSGVTLATSALVTTDVAHLVLGGLANEAGRVGEPVESAMTLTNAGTAALSSGLPSPGNPIAAQPTPNDENVRGRFFIAWDGGALEPATASSCGTAACASPDVSVEFYDEAIHAYRAIYNLRAELDSSSSPTGRLYGYFGALSSQGVPVPASYTGTYLFRTMAKRHTGGYTVTPQLVGITTGTMYAQAADQTISIDTGLAASIEIVSGDAGVAIVGGNAYDSGDLVVLVRDVAGNPVAGASVAFNVIAGANGAGASLTSPAVTDASGETRVSASSNAVAGAFEVSAKLSSGVELAVPFGLLNTADVDLTQVQLAMVSGNGQTAQVGTPYGMPLVASVSDRFGNPLEGIAVDFAALDPGAGISPNLLSGTSGPDGRTSSGVITANVTAGAFIVTAMIEAAQCDATAPGVAICAVDYGLTNTAGGAASVTLASSAADAAVGSAGAYTLTATVRDANSNLVEGVSVTLVGPNSGAGIAPALAAGITTAAGEVSHTFDANTVAGAFQVQAVVSGADSANVGLENLPGSAASIELVSGTNQAVPVNTAFSDLTVRVIDQYGNAVADGEAAMVSFTAPGSGASAAVNATATSGAGGLATTPAMANGEAGAYSVVATFGSTNLAFALQNTVGDVGITGIVWADNTATSIAYDGAPHAATATVTGSSLTPAFTYNGSATAPTAAGTYQVIAAIDDGNVLGSASAMLTITPAAAGASGITLTGGSFTYDGAAHPASVANPNGVAYTLAYAPGGNNAPVNAGSYDVTLTVSDPNFAPETMTATILIDPAEVTLAFGNLGHVYDGTAKTATVTATPSVAGLDLAYSQSGVAATPINAGSYDVTASLSNPNHVLAGSTAAVLTIAKANAQVQIGNTAQVYDGTPKAVTVATVPAGLTVDVTYDGNAGAPTAVGEYAVVAMVNEANHVGQATATLRITAAGVTITDIVWADNSATSIAYDGTPRAATATVDGNGVALTFTYSGSATAPTNAGSYLVVATVDEGNVQGTASAWLTITPIPAGNSGIVLAGGTFVYDAQPHPATVTNPNAVAYSLTYHPGGSSEPLLMGSYTATLMVTDPNYAAEVFLTTITIIDDSGSCSLFCDGFEEAPTPPGADALAVPGDRGGGTAVAGWSIQRTAFGKVETVLEFVDGSGRAVAWMDTAVVTDGQWLRLRWTDAQGVEQKSAWARWNPDDLLVYGWDLTVDGLVLRFGNRAGFTEALDLILPPGSPIPEAVRALRASVRY